jgi:prepilin-type N-terminal cleavage/methylation domain-containing protein
MVKEAPKVTIVCGILHKQSTTRSGFTLIELIVAIAIIGVMATIFVPRLRSRPAQPLDQLVQKIQELTKLGYERAITTGKVHRIMFRFKEEPSVQLEMGGDQRTSLGEMKFFPIGAIGSLPTRVPWEERFVVKNFYIKGFDEAAKNLKDAFLYLLPEGLSQESVINIRDEQAGATRGMVLNPFTVQWAIYDTLQKP